MCTPKGVQIWRLLSVPLHAFQVKQQSARRFALCALATPFLVRCYVTRSSRVPSSWAWFYTGQPLQLHQPYTCPNTIRCWCFESFTGSIVHRFQSDSFDNLVLLNVSFNRNSSLGNPYSSLGRRHTEPPINFIQSHSTRFGRAHRTRKTEHPLGHVGQPFRWQLLRPVCSSRIRSSHRYCYVVLLGSLHVLHPTCFSGEN